MTSKLTIEQAKRLRNDFECWQQDYDPKDDKEQYDMFGRGIVAMDMLIAGMYQEPVAYAVSNDFWNQGNHKQHIDGKQCDLFFPDDVSHGEKFEPDDYDYVFPLYRHAQPAPVVLDAATAIRACLSEFPESARDIVEECADIAENAYRAAMLQAEPVTKANKLGNSPVIPDGYVMVPVKPTREILDEFDSIIDYGAEDSEDAWRRLLAAAPQEVKP